MFKSFQIILIKKNLSININRKDIEFILNSKNLSQFKIIKHYSSHLIYNLGMNLHIILLIVV